MLRATVLCADGDALHAALEAAIAAFDVREGNGRVKNLLAKRTLDLYYEVISAL